MLLMSVCLCRYNYIRDKEQKSKVAFVDPLMASQQAIDECERSVEDYILRVMQMSLDKGQSIFWPYHKK